MTDVRDPRQFGGSLVYLGPDGPVIEFTRAHAAEFITLAARSGSPIREYMGRLLDTDHAEFLDRIVAEIKKPSRP